MPRLVVNPGTPQAWDIHLKPGINFLGRGASNDFRFEDSSVSGAHCHVLVDSNSVVIRDMGSTNGTFVNRAKIHESRLLNGQPVRLGSVEMIFYGDEPGATPASDTPPRPAPVLRAATLPISAPSMAPMAAAPAAVATVPAAAAPAMASALRISGLSRATEETAVADPEATLQTEVISAPPAAEVDTGPKFCKFHPKSPARYLCKKCNRTFCEVCVTSLNVGGKMKTNCRACQVECVPLRVHLAGSGPTKGFFASIPGAFVYPLRGSGIFSLLVEMIIFAGILLANLMMRTGFRGIFMGILVLILLCGYLFTFLQNIIHATAAGENEMPDLPGINFLEDILLPFCRLLGLFLCCFAPAVAFIIGAFATGSPALGIAVFPAVIFGCLYFPMAFLAVAILDNVGAVNPLAVVPSILKVPREYVTTVVILILVVLFNGGVDYGVRHVLPKGLETTSIQELLAFLGIKFLESFINVYLLAVNTRILGLLYLTKKEKLNWLGH